MVPLPLRLVTRVSAGARAGSAAGVSEVWAVLAHPGRWAEFDPFISSVAPGDDPRGPLDEVAAGQRFLARLRHAPGTVVVSIDHVVDRSSVAVTAHLLPGLAEQVELLVVPSATGGSVLTVRLTLLGPLALPALIPRWLVRTVSVRLLARTAEGGLREQMAEVSSVA